MKKRLGMPESSTSESEEDVMENYLEEVAGDGSDREELNNRAFTFFQEVNEHEPIKFKAHTLHAALHAEQDCKDTRAQYLDEAFEKLENIG